MATGQPTRAMADLRTLFTVGRVADLTDGELLGRFAEHRDHDIAVASAAFEALVLRHGSMVLAACKQHLRDPNDVEDAFQATFLVLIRKASSIRNRGSLAGWLHRVARRIALRARAEAERRRAVEERSPRPTPSMDAVDQAPERSELSTALHEEIDRLPVAFRAAIVLCHLEGRTHEEAAAQLRCPVGTVRSRLVRGRDRLRAQLTRRGWSPSVIIPLLNPERPAVVPIALREATLRTASRFLLGESAVSGMSPFVASLAKATLQGMALAKLKAAALVVVVAFGVGRAGVMAISGVGEPAGSVQAQPASANTGIGSSTAPHQARADHAAPIRAIAGTVRDANGRPREGVTVIGIRATAEGVIRQVTATTADGRYSLDADAHAGRTTQLLAYEPGFAPAGKSLLVALMRGEEVDYDAVDLVLKDPVPFAGVVQDRQGNPVAGARIRVQSMDGLDSAGSTPIMDPDMVEVAVQGTPLEPLFVTMTDERGRFGIAAVPAPAQLCLDIRAEGMGPLQTGNGPVRNRTGQTPSGWYVAGSTESPAVLVMAPASRVVGRVVTSLPGVEVANLTIALLGCNRSTAQKRKVTTDTEGRFVIEGLAEGLVNVFPSDHPPDGLWTYRAVRELELQPGEDAQATIELIRGVWVEGRAMRMRLRKGDSYDPITGIWTTLEHPRPDPCKMPSGSLRFSSDGCVYEITDKPIANVRIGVYGPARPDSGGAPLFQETDESGTFRFRLPAGRTRIYVADSWPQDAQIEVAIPGAGNDVVIPEGAYTLILQPVGAVLPENVDGETAGEITEANATEPQLVSPKDLHVRGGRGSLRMFATDEAGQLITDAESGLPLNIEQPSRWAVVTGVLDHWSIRESYAEVGGIPFEQTSPKYLRVDLERQQRLPEGNWSGWQLVERGANCRLLAQVTHTAPEQTPPEVRLEPLVDLLPFAAGVDWREVDHPRFLLPAGVESDASSVEMTDAAEIMTRTFDFTVDSGATYRYRARIVADHPTAEGEAGVLIGPWSEPSEPVTIPADEADAPALLQEAARAIDQVETSMHRDYALESLAPALARIGEEAEAAERVGQIEIEDFRRNAMRRMEAARAGLDTYQQLRLNLKTGETLNHAGDPEASRGLVDRAFATLEPLPPEQRAWEPLVEIARLRESLGDRAGSLRSLELAVESVNALREDPFQVDALAQLAIAQAELGEDQGARDTVRLILETAEASGPLVVRDVREVWMAMAAQALAAMGEIEQAEAMVTRVEEALAPTLAEPAVVHRPNRQGVSSALAALATAQLKLGKVEAARENYREAMHWIIPQNRWLIAQKQAEAGDVEGAIANTLAIDGHPQSLKVIALVQAESGDVDGALRTIEHIPRMDWVRASALAQVAAAQASAGDPVRAEAIFGEARRFLDELPDGHLKAQTAEGVLHLQAIVGDIDTARDWARGQQSAYVRARALTGIVEGMMRHTVTNAVQQDPEQDTAGPHR